MLLVENKKARIKYAVQETYSAGLELSGSEAKALRAKSGSLDGSRVVVRGGEAYLVGMTIPPYQAKNTPKDYDAERPRRLLLKKDEVAQLVDIEDKKGLTIVPLEVYNNRYIKVRVAVVKGKTKTDHREDIKKRESDIDIERAMKHKKR